MSICVFFFMFARDRKDERVRSKRQRKKRQRRMKKGGSAGLKTLENAETGQR